MKPSTLHPNVAEILEGPARVGSEQRWVVRLVDGRQAVFAALLPELAREPAVRRRYDRDIEHRAALVVQGLAPMLDHETPEDPSKPPWRLRVAPVGETLQALVERSAPLAASDATEIAASIADVLARLHAEGVVVRDLSPRVVVLTADGPVLTDVGLARVDILSTRTAASLVLEGSPYASPEQLRKTVVDGRSDIYSLGVMLWQLLTDTFPHGDGLAILRKDEKTPSLRAVRADLPVPLCTLVERCIAGNPEARPASAEAVARALRGEALPAVVDKTTCQSCGAHLRLGQRLCTSCGKLAVVFRTAAAGDRDARRLELVRLKESAGQMLALTEILAPLSATRLPPLNFILGEARMYSKEERARGIRLPRTLFDGLDEQSAIALKQRFDAASIKTRIRSNKPVPFTDRKVRFAIAAAILVAAGVAIGTNLVAGVGVMAVLICIVVVTARAMKRSRGKQSSMLQLRQGPAALPASDPLVGRLAALLDKRTPEDVRERVGELALSVQNLVDHSARLAQKADRAEVSVVTEPIEPLVGLIEAQVRLIAKLDAELATLDEGALVRGLAAAKARSATPTEQAVLLDGLDRLRTLEDGRAQALHRLLTASELLRRSVSLGLAVSDDQAAFGREVALAMQSLES